MPAEQPTGENPTVKQSTMKQSKVMEDEPLDLVKLQQTSYRLFGHQHHIIYNLYPSLATLKWHMLQQLKQWVMKEPNSEHIQSWAELIWAQRYFVGEANAFGVRTSPIFVFCIYDEKYTKGQISHPLDIRSKKFSPHIVYRVQKCTKCDADERNCCALFVDEFGRVYKDWADFVENNKFNDCLMLTPKNGIYAGHPTNDQVYLDAFHRRGGITKVLDLTSTVGSLGSVGVIIAGSVATASIGPGILLGAGVAGAACAVYTGGRSIYNLFDRGSHKQTISLKNREARSDWLNIGSGVLMGVTAGTSSVVSRMLNKGKDIPKYAQGAVRATQFGSFGFQTVGCVDGYASIYTKYRKGEDISMLEVAQVASSTFLWVHSASNLPIKENTPQFTGRRKMMKIRRHMRNQLKARIDKGPNLLYNPSTVAGDMCQKGLSVAMVKEGFEILREGQTIIREFTLSDDLMPTEYEPRDDGIIVTAKVEFFHLFDARIEKMVQKLSGYYSRPQLNALQKILIKLICKVHNITIRLIENAIDFVLQEAKTSIREKLPGSAEAINHVLPRIAQQLNELLNLTPMSDENYEQLREDIQIEHDRITQMLSNEDEEATTEDYDARRVYTQDKMLLFENYIIDGRKPELERTISAVYKRLTPEEAEIFFEICKSLIDQCNESVETKLGKPIPIDSYISTILLMLEMREDTSIGSILVPGGPDRIPEIKKEFMEIYAPVTDGQQIDDCKKCSGKKCTK